MKDQKEKLNTPVYYYIKKNKTPVNNLIKKTKDLYS